MIEPTDKKEVWLTTRGSMLIAQWWSEDFHLGPCWCGQVFGWSMLYDLTRDFEKRGLKVIHKYDP